MRVRDIRKKISKKKKKKKIIGKKKSISHTQKIQRVRVIRVEYYPNSSALR